MDNKKQINEARNIFSETIERELATQLERIPDLVLQIVEQSVLLILGISKSGRRYSVDHWGVTPLNSYIKRQVDGAMEKHINPIIEKELVRLLNLKTLRAGIIERVGESVANNSTFIYERLLTERLVKKFEELAAKHVESIEQELDKALDGVGKFSLDLDDPSSYHGPLGEILLTELAKTLSEDKS